MGPFIFAWLVGEGIVIYRAMKQPAKGQSTVAGATVLVPPSPGQLLFSSAVFVMLAILAEAPKARPLAVSLAWGFDVAAWFRLFDKLPVGATTNGKGAWPPQKMAPDNVVIPTGGWTAGQGRTLDSGLLGGGITGGGIIGRAGGTR